MITLYKGDSSPAKTHKLENIDVSDCTAEHVVRDKYGVELFPEEAVVETVTIDNIDYFNFYLTPSQTNLITDYRKEYIWSARISRAAAPEQSKEIILDTIIFLPPNLT